MTIQANKLLASLEAINRSFLQEGSDAKNRPSLFVLSSAIDNVEHGFSYIKDIRIQDKIIGEISCLKHNLSKYSDFKELYQICCADEQKYQQVFKRSTVEDEIANETLSPHYNIINQINQNMADEYKETFNYIHELQTKIKNSNNPNAFEDFLKSSEAKLEQLKKRQVLFNELLDVDSEKPQEMKDYLMHWMDQAEKDCTLLEPSMIGCALDEMLKQVEEEKN